MISLSRLVFFFLALGRLIAGLTLLNKKTIQASGRACRSTILGGILAPLDKQRAVFWDLSAMANQRYTPPRLSHPPLEYKLVKIKLTFHSDEQKLVLWTSSPAGVMILRSARVNFGLAFPCESLLVGTKVHYGV